MLAWDLWRLLQGEPFSLTSLGMLWFSIAPSSLQMLQPAIERHVAVWLWRDLIFPLLEAPALLDFGVLGLLLLWLGRKRRQRKFY